MKKRILKILIFTAIFLSLIALFLLRYEYKSQQEQLHNKYRLSYAEIDSLQDGDILLRHGFGVVSDAISRGLNEEYAVSHCAIVRKPTQDSIVVIHSVSSSLSDVDGVQSVGIKRFIRESKPNSVILVRFQDPSGKSNSLLSQRADYYLQKQVPFDNAFDIKDSSKFYCTELLWKCILDEYGIDILNVDQPDQLNANKFGVFWKSEYFNVIFNHHHRKE